MISIVGYPIMVILCGEYLPTPLRINLNSREGIDNNIFGLKVNIDNPEEAGADRLVNSFAVKCLKLSPAIVIDFGTATTFDLVGVDGSYDGGIIAPGVNLSLEALYLAAARLPKVTLKLAGVRTNFGKQPVVILLVEELCVCHCFYH